MKSSLPVQLLLLLYKFASQYLKELLYSLEKGSPVTLKSQFDFSISDDQQIPEYDHRSRYIEGVPIYKRINNFNIVFVPCGINGVNGNFINC